MWLVALLLLVVACVVLATARLSLHPFLALLLAAFGFGALSGMPLDEVVAAVNQGFGGTLGAIGIVIVAGSIIGTFLERSGGARRLAEATLRVAGERHAPAAMGLVGYVVSLPVFCDSGFVILSALNRAVARRAGITLAATTMALSLGLYATHTMVPPTPGPVAAAGIVGADLGRVIGWGLLVSALALAAGVVFAVKVAGRIQIPPDRPEPAGRLATLPDVSATDAGGGDPDAPAAGRSLLPILAPIGLIVLRSLAELPGRPFGDSAWTVALAFAGQPVVALSVGVALALLLPRRLERSMLAATGWVGEAVIAAAGILVITGAGGAFGKVLQSSGIAEAVGGALASGSLGIWLPFLLAAGIKTAQGSSTVAIITTAGMVAPLLPALGLDGADARALVVVAIGAGSMVVSHANDSYFWVVTQFSDMDLSTGYRLQTLGTLVQGAAAALAVWALHLLAL